MLNAPLLPGVTCWNIKTQSNPFFLMVHHFFWVKFFGHVIFSSQILWDILISRKLIGYSFTSIFYDFSPNLGSANINAPPAIAVIAMSFNITL